MHCISRFEGMWLHCWTQRVLINSTNFNGNHLLAASLRDPYWDEHYLLSLLNNLDDETECTSNKQVNEIKLEGAVITLENRTTFSYSLMVLRNGLTLGKLGTSTQVTVESSTWVGTILCSGTDWLENRFADKELENPLIISQPLSITLSLQERSITYRAALSMCYHQAKRSYCSALLSLNLNHHF